jgi:hypothetical protein
MFVPAFTFAIEAIKLQDVLHCRKTLSFSLGLDICEVYVVSYSGVVCIRWGMLEANFLQKFFSGEFS